MSAIADLARAAAGAAVRIRPHVPLTRLERTPFLCPESGAIVCCKLENLQKTGSFKVRGAVNKLLTLPEERRRRGVVAASTGNHGAAVAYACGRLETRGLVFVPESASQAKLRAIERLGGELRPVPGDPVEAEKAARRHAEDHDLEYVSPYNDLDVVAGQGTVGVELAEDLPEIHAVFVATGGGGLISGVGAVLKQHNPGVQVIGCSPENSAVMVRSVEAGRVLELESKPTLSDGTAGGVEPDAITLPLCQAVVDEWITVSEEQIAESLREFMGVQSMPIEGSAAAAIAAFKSCGRRFADQNVVIILCGGNIGPEALGAA